MIETIETLSTAEIDFLRSLGDSELASVIAELTPAEQSTVLWQLAGDTASQASEIPKPGESRQARYERKKSAWSQDIGRPEIGPADEALRAECDASLRRHLEVCYPNAFPLEWSPDHIRLIDRIQRSVIEGDLKAIAMPRGSGKTTILLRAALWAILTGFRRFCCVISATETAAKKLLIGIKKEILFNPQLASLYPAELFALKSLDGEPKRPVASDRTAS